MMVSVTSCQMIHFRRVNGQKMKSMTDQKYDPWMWKPIMATRVAGIAKMVQPHPLEELLESLMVVSCISVLCNGKKNFVGNFGEVSVLEG